LGAAGLIWRSDLPIYKQGKFVGHLLSRLFTGRSDWREILERITTMLESEAHFAPFGKRMKEYLDGWKMEHFLL